MKKLLIITYYWPPSGGGGVQRPLKFAKYLPEFGWQPVIYTAENPEYPVLDSSLEKDIPEEAIIIKNNIWEPFSLYKKFTGRKKEERLGAGFLSEKSSGGIKEKVAFWVRSNFFIPDARMFWIKPSIKFLVKYLKEDPVDAILSTGPPHSVHLIAKGVKEKTGIPWIADFRDPWTDIDFYKSLPLTSWADKKHRKLEKEILKAAGKVITVSPGCAESLINAGAKETKVITNGYDEEDFQVKVNQPDQKFTLTHTGSLNKDRNPRVLWSVLQEMSEEDKAFKQDLLVKVIGQADHSVKEYVKEHRLTENIQLTGYVPHEETVKKMMKSQVLLLLLNNTPTAKGILTGKLFEYLAAKRPVFCIGPTDGDAAKIISETNTGTTIDFDDKEKMKKVILNWYGQFKSGNLKCQSARVEKYSRKNLTGELVEELEEFL